MAMTRSQEIADTLRLSLQRGTLTCGDRLVELTLSQEYQVSQNTIRDALHILERDGWVKKFPRRGVYVPRFTVVEATEIYALWRAVGGLTLGWAMDHLQDADREHLRDTLSRAERYLNAHDALGASRMIHTLHARIASHAQAPRTETILVRLRNQVLLMENHRVQCQGFSLDEWDTRIERLLDVMYEVDQHDKPKAMRYYERAIYYESQLIMPYLD